MNFSLVNYEILVCVLQETTSEKVLQNPAGRSAIVTLGSVACPLPDLPISLQLSRDYSLLSYSINVSLSNDGNAYSNSMKFTVYDGLSLICDTTGCVRRVSYCAVFIHNETVQGTGWDTKTALF